jgi:hypothetical protein
MTLVPRSTATNSDELLDELVDVIETEPQRLLMSDWVAAFEEPDILPMHGLEPACGTIACAAGWIKILRRPVDRSAAAQLIGGATERFALNQFPESAQFAMLDLFYTFPDSAGDRPKPGTREYVDVVVARIRDIQQRHAADLKAFKLEAVQ